MTDRFENMVTDPTVVVPAIQEERAALESEWGSFQVKPFMGSGRVAVLPADEEVHVAYLIEGRLILDDYLEPDELEEAAQW